MCARTDARQLRRDAGIGLATVARAFGVSEKDVWRWETGRHVPCSEAARRWARFTAALERRAAFRRENP
jgi:DNA-binding transcriptional regulator YiaG